MRRHLPAVVLLAAGLLAVFGACLLGSTALPPQRVLAALAGLGPAGDQVVVWEIRAPRAVAP